MHDVVMALELLVCEQHEETLTWSSMRKCKLACARLQTHKVNYPSNYNSSTIHQTNPQDTSALLLHSLVHLNRVRTGNGRFKSNMNQMGLPPSALCEFGAANQTAPHIASEYPLHSCNGDLVVLDTVARNWLRDLQCVV